jgi:hypothetical protein
MSVHEHRHMARMMVQHVRWPTRARITNANSKTHDSHRRKLLGRLRTIDILPLGCTSLSSKEYSSAKQFNSECEASTSNGTKAWTLILMASVGPSQPGWWSEWASVECQYYSTTRSTYNNTYRNNIMASVGPSRPGWWSEWASVECQYYSMTRSTYDNTYRNTTLRWRCPISCSTNFTCFYIWGNSVELSTTKFSAVEMSVHFVPSWQRSLGWQWCVGGRHYIRGHRNQLWK